MTSRSVNQFEITVAKDHLLTLVEENRTKHQENYEEAMKVYEEECIEALQDRLSALQSLGLETIGPTPQSLDPSRYLAFDIKTPISYTHVYDQLIAMLQMAETQTLTINGEQYQNWVNDEWDWTRHYAASTLSKLR